ncbi:pallilysin-related adhesin [Treponema parvum]|uniref:Pallilysin-related adhesin n=1 Tax=Treponema parvum TaxID=138851 RepID=A0A975F4Z1_9SPIR|nr:pallilysin-related adhesin [Treponema parvum]QTQ14749.1 pallilysin-related adhesin [Treponema parvum]
MKNRAVFVFFVIFAACMTIFFIIYGSASSKNSAPPQPKIVTPFTGTARSEAAENNPLASSDGGLTSFIPLNSDETLVSILTLDIDNDMRDDQINLVQKLTKPYLYLLIGLYNPGTGAYERTAELETPITQIHSFSYACIDVLGDHRPVLVYQGVTDDGISVLQIYRIRKGRNRVAVLENIGDFRSDGSIFVQQQPRDQAYELSQVNAAPFPIIVYGSDPESAGDGHEQFQIKYEWKAQQNKFVQTERIRLSDSRIAANELAKIRDGTVKTFANYLKGVWYKTSDDGKGIRYLFFDPENSEIILQHNDTEEVYTWFESYLSSSGIYLSTENLSISSLHRRYYITLVAADEIRLRIQEDLGMTINEINLWDGNYKKADTKASFGTKAARSQDFIKDLTSGDDWYSADGTKFSFSADTYTASGDSSNEAGKFSILEIDGEPVIMFRPLGERSFLKSAYQLSYKEVVPQAAPSRRTGVPTAVTDRNTIIMHAISLSLKNPAPLKTAPLTLSRNSAQTARK